MNIWCIYDKPNGIPLFDCMVEIFKFFADSGMERSPQPPVRVESWNYNNMWKNDKQVSFVMKHIYTSQPPPYGSCLECMFFSHPLPLYITPLRMNIFTALLSDETEG
jgi:hypothetical protein